MFSVTKNILAVTTRVDARDTGNGAPELDGRQEKIARIQDDGMNLLACTLGGLRPLAVKD